MKRVLSWTVCIFFIFSSVYAEVDPGLVTSRRAQLESQLQQYENEINQTQGQIDQKRQEAQTLQRDISLIDSDIKLKTIAIKQRTLTINKLVEDVGDKSDNIKVLAGKISQTQGSLAETLRLINEHDKISAIELAMEYNDLAQFFYEAESFSSLQGAVQDAFSNLTEFKSEEEDARNTLEDRQQQEIQLRALQQSEQKNLQALQKNRQQILKETKGQESEYQKILTAKKKDAAAIRSALFLLQGSPAIPFEKALEYANIASRATGVRAAFILGVISQESDLGKNIGQCNLPDDPPQHKWRAVMKPGRDDKPFLAITAELGLDPEKMPVSCPLRDSKKNRVGWGGAMGPAQFIPSTWVLYKSAIARISGHNPPNPWDPKDAIIGAGLLLKDNGAVGSRANERTAAAKYFAGGNWNTSLGRTYASQVLARVDSYQDQIDLLQSLAQR